VGGDVAGEDNGDRPIVAITTGSHRKMKKSTYLFLLALDRNNARIGREILENIQERVDEKASPAFLHASGVGIFLTSTLTSFEIWKQVWPDILSEAEKKSLRDAVIIALGADFSGFQQGKPAAWLIKHSAEAQAAA
jgi:hypothetical protein